MADSFEFDVFLSHHSADKAEVRKLKDRLEGDGLRVWLDEEQIQPGDHIPNRVRAGLKTSRRIALIMTSHGFASDWVEAEIGTRQYLDPLNRAGRLVPILFADCEKPELLAPLHHIDYRDRDESQYQRLRDCLRSPLEIAFEPANTPTDEDEDEGKGRVPWIVKTLDHFDMAAPLQDRLDTAPTPTIAVIDGHDEDRPGYLADDVFLVDRWPPLDHKPPTAMPIKPNGEQAWAFWKATHQKLPARWKARIPGQEREAVRAFIREQPCHLFYVSIGIRERGLRLRRLIQGARTFLEELAGDQSGTNPAGLLMLIACMPDHDGPPRWWRWWRGYCRWRLPGVFWLHSLHPLNSTHIAEWCAGFTDEAARCYCEITLKNGFQALFGQHPGGIRYHLAERYLWSQGGLKQARQMIGTVRDPQPRRTHHP